MQIKKIMYPLIHQEGGFENVCFNILYTMGMSSLVGLPVDPAASVVKKGTICKRSGCNKVWISTALFQCCSIEYFYLMSDTLFIGTH